MIIMVFMWVAGLVAFFERGQAGGVTQGLSSLPDCLIVEAGDYSLESWMSQQRG